MASCAPFSVEFSGSAQELFIKIATMIHDHGGTITGGPSGGAFTVGTPLGTVSGTFTVSGQTCTITITQRPFLLPCSVIQNFIKSHLPAVAQAQLGDL